MRTSRPLSDSNEPTYRKDDDISFYNKVSADLRQQLSYNPIKYTWGYCADYTVNELLQIAKPPRTNLELGITRGSVQALFLSTGEASLELSTGSSLNIPIFVNGQQGFTWSSDTRPIAQLLKLYDPKATIYVNIASLPLQGPSYDRMIIADVQSRFADNMDHGDKWNLLDTKCPLPDTYSVCPKFLQIDNCTLLNRIKDTTLSKRSAGRTIASNEDLASWREVEQWVLLAEPGANTGPHQDSHGLETFITVNEGEIGFGWLDRPTEEDLHIWARDPQGFRGGKWCHTVLRPGQTVWFPSGLVHFVFRPSGDGRQTMAIGGHTLRHSNIKNWAKTIALQLEYPDTTNEEMHETIPRYLEVVAHLVSQTKVTDLKIFGGKENIAKFIKHIGVCPIPLL
jgi:hypothetical protein